MADPKWKRFEQLAYEIQKELSGNAEVTLNEKLKGEDSKTDRQIDISIRQKVGQFVLLVIIDCKDYKHPVDVKVIGEFVTTIRDVRAHKGAIVSSSGFTEAAIELAKHHGIDTFRLIDTKNTDWKAYISVPALLERSFLARFRLRIKSSQPLPLLKITEPKLLRLYSTDGEFLGTVGDIIADKWNGQGINHDPGEYEISIGPNVAIENEQTRFLSTIIAIIEVRREYYFGQLPLQARGFKNEQDGGFITKELTTTDIAPFRIEQGLEEGWARVDDPQQLAVRPFITMAYADVIPRSTRANP